MKRKHGDIQTGVACSKPPVDKHLELFKLISTKCSDDILLTQIQKFPSLSILYESSSGISRVGGNNLITLLCKYGRVNLLEKLIEKMGSAILDIVTSKHLTPLQSAFV